MKTTSRKILSLLLSCALLCALAAGIAAIPATAHAATGAVTIDISSLSDTNTDNSASAATESRWSYMGTSKQLLLSTAGGNYTLTGTNSNLFVWVDAADVNVTLDDADITWPGTASYSSAISGSNDANGLTITLVGNNTLTGGNGTNGGGLAFGDQNFIWTITSTNGGSLTTKGYNSNDYGIRFTFYDTDILNIRGNASVTAAGGMASRAIFAGSGFNNIMMADDAQLAITNNSTTVETHDVCMTSDTLYGREWRLGGAAVFHDDDNTATMSSTKIDIPSNGKTGTIRLVTPLSLLTAAAVANQVYTGAAIKPVPVIKDGSKTLVNGTDFTLAYANNTAVGTATITVTGIGAYSGTRSVNFTIVPATPVLASLANSTTGPLLKWNKAAGATGYYVMRKTGTGSWASVKKITAATTLSYTDTTAVSGTTYSYSVRAYGGAGSTLGSYNTTGKSITYVATPKLTSAVNAATGVKFTWGKVSGATGYLIYRKTGTGAWTKVKTITSAATVAWTDTAVKTGTTYTYTAKAYKTSTSNISAYNTTGKKVIYVAMPKLTSLKNSKSGPVLKWGKITNATGYLIYRKVSGGAWVKVATITKVGTLTWTDKAAANKKTYYYTIKAYKTSSTVVSAYSSTGWKITVKK